MNNLYPAKPNYKGKTKGWFGFPHHNHLVEYYGDITQRVKEIPEWKPENELQIRYDHIVYVPEKLVPKYVKEAHKRYLDADKKSAEANKKYYEAYEKYNEALREYWEAYEEYVEANKKRVEADKKCDGAGKKWREAYKKYLLALEKANKNPTLIKYLKQNTPFQWSEEDQSLIFP